MKSKFENQSQSVPPPLSAQSDTDISRREQEAQGERWSFVVEMVTFPWGAALRHSSLPPAKSSRLTASRSYGPPLYGMLFFLSPTTLLIPVWTVSFSASSMFWGHWCLNKWLQRFKKLPNKRWPWTLATKACVVNTMPCLYFLHRWEFTEPLWRVIRRRVQEK